MTAATVAIKLIGGPLAGRTIDHRQPLGWQGIYVRRQGRPTAVYRFPDGADLMAATLVATFDPDGVPDSDLYSPALKAILDKARA